MSILLTLRIGVYCENYNHSTVQARMGSTRLPNKVMKAINGVPMIELLLARLSQSKELDQIVVVNSIDTKNILLVEHECRAKKNNEESLHALRRMSERVC